MGKKKVVLDTNIIISAFGWGGKPEEIIKKVINKEIELIISTKQLVELRNAVGYPRLKFSDIKKERILSFISMVSTIIITKSKINVVKADPKDNIILEPANEIKIDYIITGDKKHLLPLKKCQKPPIRDGWHDLISFTFRVVFDARNSTNDGWFSSTTHTTNQRLVEFRCLKMQK